MRSRREAHNWQAGWWGGASRQPSPYCDERPPGIAISLVVMHSISLPPGIFGGHDVEGLFTGTLDCTRHPYYERLKGLRVSAHFLIRRDGHLQQFVSCDQRAWHAGVSAWRGVTACNDFSIGIELEGLEGGSFAAVQYRAAGQLLRVLSSRYPVDEVVGHEHVAPGRKQDPGAGFDWARLRRSVRSGEPHVWPMLRSTC